MTDRAALVERVAKAIRSRPHFASLDHARHLTDLIRDLALEEAAKVADNMWVQGHGNLPVEPYAATKQVSGEIAAAIRDLKSKA